MFVSGMKVVGGMDIEPPKRKRRSKRKMTVTQAASDGSTRELLVAMRDRVARAVENPDTPARDLAALTKRLMDIAREIKAIDTQDTAEAGGRIDTRDEEFDPSTI